MQKIVMSFVAASALLYAQNVTATSQLHVCKSGCDYTSIQSAIESAPQNAIIDIAPGVYQENLNIKDKCISLIGEDGQQTVIDADNKDRGIAIEFQDINTTAVPSCEMHIENLQIKNAQSDKKGGGVYVYNSIARYPMHIVLNNLTVVNNRAQEGAGVYIATSYSYSAEINLSVKNTLFSNNSAETKGGGISTTLVKFVQLKDVKLQGNIANQYGGAIYSNNSKWDVFNTKMEGNDAFQDGGGVYLYYSTMHIAYSILDNNSASRNGGALYCGNGSKLFINKGWIVDNSANEKGGAVYFGDTANEFYANSSLFAMNYAKEVGGALFFNGKGVVVSSTFIANNDANDSDIYINNTDTGGLIPELYLKDSAIGKLLFAKIDETASGNYVIKNNVFGQNVVFPQIQKLIEENNSYVEDFGYKDIQNYDFSLVDNSPLIDKADSATSDMQDITGRYRDSMPDVGACEYPHTCIMKIYNPSLVTPPTPPETNVTECNVTVQNVTLLLDIHQGWNLVSIPGLSEMAIEEIFPVHLSDIKTIWFWKENGWYVYTENQNLKTLLEGIPLIRSVVDSGYVLEPTRGFWVQSNADFTRIFVGKKVQ